MNLWQCCVHRIPFTTTMLVILVGAGIYGRSHVGLLDEQLHQQVGLSIRQMFRGEVHRTFTSLLFTAGGWRFYSSIVMFALATGSVEWNRGTPRAAGTFFGIHFATLTVMAIAVLTWNLVTESHRGNLLWHVQDVGPSAGYYGCLGFAVAALATNLRWPVIMAVLTLLTLRASWSFVQLPEEGRTLSADIAHLIAFPLGILTVFL